MDYKKEYELLTTKYNVMEDELNKTKQLLTFQMNKINNLTNDLTNINNNLFKVIKYFYKKDKEAYHHLDSDLSYFDHHRRNSICKNIPDLFIDEQFAKQIIQLNGLEYIYLPSDYKENKQLLLLANKQWNNLYINELTNVDEMNVQCYDSFRNESVLEFTSKKMKNDIDIIYKLIMDEEKYFAFKFMSDELKNDKQKIINILDYYLENGTNALYDLIENISSELLNETTFLLFLITNYQEINCTLENAFNKLNESNKNNVDFIKQIFDVCDVLTISNIFHFHLSELMQQNRYLLSIYSTKMYNDHHYKRHKINTSNMLLCKGSYCENYTIFIEHLQGTYKEEFNYYGFIVNLDEQKQKMWKQNGIGENLMKYFHHPDKKYY